MIYGSVRDPETGHYKMRSNAQLAQIYQSPDIIQERKSGRLRWVEKPKRSPNKTGMRGGRKKTTGNTQAQRER